MEEPTKPEARKNPLLKEAVTLVWDLFKKAEARNEENPDYPHLSTFRDTTYDRNYIRFRVAVDFESYIKHRGQGLNLFVPMSESAELSLSHPVAKNIDTDPDGHFLLQRVDEKGQAGPIMKYTFQQVGELGQDLETPDPEELGDLILELITMQTMAVSQNEIDLHEELG